MAGNKKPPKRAQGWDRGGKLLRHEPWRLHSVFAPIDHIIDDIDQRGEVMVMVDEGEEVPCFKHFMDGCTYPIKPSLEGMCDSFDMHCEHWKRPMLSGGLRDFMRLIEDGAELCQADIDAARASVVDMKREASQMTIRYASDLVQRTSIKIEIENKIARSMANAG
jgi:hypothetical protein